MKLLSTSKITFNAHLIDIYMHAPVHRSTLEQRQRDSCCRRPDHAAVCSNLRILYHAVA